MTLCIGGLCNQKRKLGGIVLGLDMRMTYEAQDKVVAKHDLTSKLFQLPFGFAGAVAGTFSGCERFISFLWEYMEQVSAALAGGPLEVDHIDYAAKRAQWQVILSLFENKLVTELGLTRKEWLDRSADRILKLEGRALLKKIEPDVSCLIAGFLPKCPVLIRIAGKHPPEEIVSHSTIGFGSKFAIKKLAARQQGPYCSIQRTALAVSEALRYARTKTKYVGPPAHCVVLEPGLARQFDPNAKLLRRWSKIIKNKDSEKLDSDEYWNEFSPLLSPISRIFKLSVSQTAEQEP
jgi:hypothetical protein